MNDNNVTHETNLELGNFDSAIIFREDGSIELRIPSEGETLNDSAKFAVAIATCYARDPEFMNLLEDRFYKFMEEAEQLAKENEDEDMKDIMAAEKAIIDQGDTPPQKWEEVKKNTKEE